MDDSDFIARLHLTFYGSTSIKPSHQRPSRSPIRRPGRNCATRQLPRVRKTVSFSRSLETDHCRSVGDFIARLNLTPDFVARLHLIFCSSTSSGQGTVKGTSSYHSPKVSSSVVRGPVSPGQGSCVCVCGGGGGEVLLLTLLTCHQENGWYSSDSQPQRVECLPPHREIQDGDPCFYSPESTAGYVGDFTGLDRRLFSRSDLSSTQEAFEIHFEGLSWIPSCVSVGSFTIQASNSPQVFFFFLPNSWPPLRPTCILGIYVHVPVSSFQKHHPGLWPHWI